jgi:hypothetical protein
MVLSVDRLFLIVAKEITPGPDMILIPFKLSTPPSGL